MTHRLSAQAEHDIDEIAYALANETGSVAIAERFVDSITVRFYLLAEHPKIGRARDDLFAGARTFPVGNYMIVYAIDGDEVQILRVLHGRRDIAALFSP